MKILPEIDRFEKEHEGEELDLNKFSQWLYANKEQSEKQPTYTSPLKWHGQGKGGKAHFTASNLLTAISRYKNNYVKLALEGSPFETYDEFAFVLSLVFIGPCTQTALIEKHIQLKPTGVEIIKRLIKKKLIIQSAGENDRRSKILSVTPSGRASFHTSLTKINLVTDLMMSPLNEEEKLLLLQLLQRLDTPHRQIFNESKKITLDYLQAYFNHPLSS
ncbi:winged helix DNA-binding protein [Chitinophaga pendula]|uniref:winged helix DNA-binding protein n=1 Tax=Chitinophaga TaxID=79328 RepID=UPI0012FD7FB3|nr:MULTISPECIES: winged helix DNA-binding protein [Chitinophaga]UCJ04857.1 winged helix DNA-binding protein [Chitinophaga pendula]